MTPELMEEAVVDLAILTGYLLVLGVGCLIADFVFPHIPFIERYLESLPDWEDENEVRRTIDMRREGMTVREAAEEWVREMNAIQQGMIDKLMRANPDDWSELTIPAAGDSVYVFNLPDGSKDHYGEISSYDEESELYAIRLSDGKLVSAEKDDFEVQYDDRLPMWGTMWSFGDSCDDWWLEKGDGIRVMSECGFRIYESEEFGYFFGIDGAGYSFYEAHWCPLYRARGLQWHDPDTEKGGDEK